MSNGIAGIEQIAPAGHEMFEAALASSDDALFIAELAGPQLTDAVLVFVNPALEALSGRPAHDLVGQSPEAAIGPTATRAVNLATAESASGVETLARRGDGTPFWAEISVRAIETGAGARVLGTVRDVDERHHAAARLAHAATHDPLTGLPNRALLLERLDRELARPLPNPANVAVLFVDLDGFKLINDSMGHECGDLVLQEAASRIDGCLGTGDTVGRFGGDEFVVVHAPATGRSCDDLGARILAAMTEPIVVAGREIVISASIGVASIQQRTSSRDQLVRDADTALYAAKRKGRNRVEVFTAELVERAMGRLRIESDLRAALRHGHLYVDYQPQVDLSSGAMVGVEALVRWRHPERGVIPPVEFIGVAEECGLIVPLGRQVIEDACAQLADWRHRLAEPPPSVTVNVSLRQLDAPGFADVVRCALAEAEIEPSALCLELTESAIVDPDSDAVAVLSELRELGVYVAIDDFGMEYSSLARLRDLPVEVLKVDRSFVDGLGTEPGDTAIVSSILSLAFAMGLHVIAEGVETEQQANTLRDLGCGVAQGFLFSRPVDPSSIAALTGQRLWTPPRATASPVAAVAAVATESRRGRRYFVDEFLDQIGAPMGADESPGRRA